MNEVGAKLLIAAAIFSISFLSAAAPLTVINVNDRIFSCGNLLASGVLLAGGLVHQLPDSIKNLERWIAVDFPLATFVAGLTFCLFLVLEEVLHSNFEDTTLFEEDDGRSHHDNQNDANVDDQPFSYPIDDTPAIEEGDSRDGQWKGNIEQERIEMETQRLHQARSRPKSTGGMLAIRKSIRPSVFNAWQKESFEKRHPVHHHDDHLAKHMHGSLLASIILLLALSVHSIFEGLAIGVSPDMANVMSTAAAVLTHKAFAGYALGSSMVASQMKDGHFLVLVFVFSSCSILGILLGMLFEELANGSNVDIITGVIQAMVAGTFLYVSIVEIGMKELMMYRESETPKDGALSPKTMDLLKLTAFLTGYLAMSALAIWV